MAAEWQGAGNVLQPSLLLQARNWGVGLEVAEPGLHHALTWGAGVPSCGLPHPASTGCVENCVGSSNIIFLDYGGSLQSVGFYTEKDTFYLV